MAEEFAEPEAAPVPPSVKVFLGGLSWDTSEETLTNHFSKFGAVEDAVVMRDRMTKMPRGFGFITFKDPEAAAAACREAHTIDRKTIEAKPSVPQSDSGKPKGKKLFVGGLAADTSSEDFKAYFEKFGAVSDAQIMYDPNTKRSRGFGFVTYEDEASVVKVLNAGHMHELGGKQVEVKNATPKGAGGAEGRGGSHGFGGAGGGRGGPGGRGGYGGRGGFPQFAPPSYGGAYGYMPQGPYGYMSGVPGAYDAYPPGMMMGYGQFAGYGGGQPQQQQQQLQVLQMQRQQQHQQQQQQHRHSGGYGGGGPSYGARTPQVGSGGYGHGPGLQQGAAFGGGGGGGPQARGYGQ